MTQSALSAQQYSDAQSRSSSPSQHNQPHAPELRSSLNRVRLALMNLSQIDLNGYKPSLRLIRFGQARSELEGNIDTMFSWLAHGLRIANGISDKALQDEILATVARYEDQDLYLAYHLAQLNTLSMANHPLTPTLQNWLLGVIQHHAIHTTTGVDLLRLSKITSRFGIDIPYNHCFDRSQRPPVFFSHDYVHDVLSALWMRPTELDAQVTPADQLELEGLYATRQMLQRYLRHCGIGVNLFLADAKNEWGGWIYCYLNDDGQVHELWASGTLSPFPNLVHFLRMVLLGELPASFDWDEEGIIKTFIAEPDANRYYFRFRLVTDVPGSNTRQVLIDAIYHRYEFVASVYAGLRTAQNLKPYWGLPDEKIAALKRMLHHHQNLRR